MEILNLTSESIFPSKDLPFYIGKYYHTNFSDLKIHTHDFIEIVYVYDGKGYHIYNNVTYPVSKGGSISSTPGHPTVFIHGQKQFSIWLSTTSAFSRNLSAASIFISPSLWS